MNKLKYELSLSPGSKHIITPLAIPDFKERKSGSTANTEYVEFEIRNLECVPDKVTLEVLADGALIYSEQETNTSQFLPQGKHIWRWDGYSNEGILNTDILKKPTLLVRLTAIKEDQRHVVELELKNKGANVEWIDVRIDRNKNTAEVTVRPSLTEGRVEGRNSEKRLTPLPYSQLEAMAKQGIEHYWSRNGTRAPGIGKDITTAKGASYKVTVTANVNVSPKGDDFLITEKMDNDYGRSRSVRGVREIYHNLGFHHDNKSIFVDEDFKNTAAHELGHIFLDEYGDDYEVRMLKVKFRILKVIMIPVPVPVKIPIYSSTHKGTSTIEQDILPNHPIPISGEIDLMNYFSNQPEYPYRSEAEKAQYQDFFARSVAAEEDVKGLVWLARVRFEPKGTQKSDHSR